MGCVRSFGTWKETECLYIIWPTVPDRNLIGQPLKRYEKFLNNNNMQDRTLNF